MRTVTPKQTIQPDPDTGLLGPFDISDEESRIYYYPEYEVFIAEPWKLWASESGAHRIQVLDGEVHYLPPGFQVLSWYPRDIDNAVRF
jgi:hypothetical protein